jgi:hypothetical protein
MAVATTGPFQMLRSLCVIDTNFTILRHFLLRLWRNEIFRYFLLTLYSVFAPNRQNRCCFLQLWRKLKERESDDIICVESTFRFQTEMGIDSVKEEEEEWSRVISSCEHLTENLTILLFISAPSNTTTALSSIHSLTSASRDEFWRSVYREGLGRHYVRVRQITDRREHTGPCWCLVLTIYGRSADCFIQTPNPHRAVPLCKHFPPRL